MAMTGEVTTNRATSRQLVGRERELARLEALLADATADHSVQTVFVEGEAGVGKTRTVQEFASRATARGANVLVGRCVAYGEQILPYAPLVELLTDLVRRRGAAEVVRLAGHAAPELARWIPALADSMPVPEPTRASASLLFRAVSAVIDGLGVEAPVIVIVEDLHWADRSTLELITLLGGHLRGDTLLVFTVRTDEPPHDVAVTRFIAESGRRSGRHVVLGRLTRDEQALQLSDILGIPPHRALLDDIYGRAEGNPFFAEELLVLGSGGDLPATIRDLLLARLEELAPATRQALRAASVIGRRVPHRLLEHVADVPAPALDAALRPAVEHHVLLTETGDGGAYVFRHALLQEAIAGGLLPGEAARLHRRVAETLSDRPELAGDPGSVPGRIARHWDAAGDAPRALTAAVDAARAAARALAFSESLSHYERAVTLLDTLPDEDVHLDAPCYKVLWSAAEVAHLAACPERAAELVRRAIAAVDPAEQHHHGYLHERLGRYLWMAAEGEDALVAYERAVELVPAEPVTSWRAAVLSGYSQVLMLAGRFEESAPVARQAIAIARQVGARSVEGHARNNLGVDLSYLGELEEGIAELRTARRIAEEEFEDVDDIARAIVNLHSALYDAGRMTEAANVAIDGIDIVEGLGLRERKGVWCRCDAAEALLQLGRNTEATQLLDEADALQPAGVDAVRVDLIRGRLLFRLGDLDGARSRLDAARHAGARLIDTQLLGPLYATLVEVLAAQGRFDEALAMAEQGREKLRHDEHAVFSVPLFAAAAAATAAAASGSAAIATDSRDSRADIDEVRSWVVRSAEALSRSRSVNPVASADHAVAQCELTDASGHADAEAWLAAAEGWQDLQNPFREIQARLRATAAMLANGGDRASAAHELRTAWTTADRIGAAHLHRLAEDVAKRARITLREDPPDSSDDPYHLTRRERDVLALVAEGLTDRAIGDRLFISHRTVERHVSNLLAKLGAARRSELTAIAHRAGLADREPVG
ncbi:helix-turn-helix transcriptional regulator [Agromyces sp. H66]|uniref:helix-turn-helix transcriptional regulator n=1 Tax=Agromyces sp. H66 TaxID=2529859 RepID=UPI0010AAB4AE|nr:helix-turn-helix transcriptional regulator [Agromyces sp. H66]